MAKAKAAGHGAGPGGSARSAGKNASKPAPPAPAPAPAPTASAGAGSRPSMTPAAALEAPRRVARIRARSGALGRDLACRAPRKGIEGESREARRPPRRGPGRDRGADRADRGHSGTRGPRPYAEGPDVDPLGGREAGHAADANPGEDRRLTRTRSSTAPVPRRPGAAIDLGSTSVHLLVARPERDGLVGIQDESTFLGLGAAVDGPGSLDAVGRATLVATVGDYVDQARAAGATDPVVMGTEPLRRLTDATRIVAEVSARTGVPLVVLEHEEEALLTLVGLTAGRSVQSDLLVVDIGGGSSEIVEIGPGRLARASGISLGAGRLTRQIVDRDPPTAAHFAELRRAAELAFDWTPSRTPSDVVFVGGTATNLLKLLRRAGNPDRDERLDRDDLRIAREVVSSGPAELSPRPMAFARPGSASSRLARRSSRPSSTASALRRDASSTRASGKGPSWPPIGPGPTGAQRLEELAHGWIARSSSARPATPVPSRQATSRAASAMLAASGSPTRRGSRDDARSLRSLSRDLERVAAHPAGDSSRRAVGLPREPPPRDPAGPAARRAAAAGQPASRARDVALGFSR